jgi:hypothetical protein
VALPVDDRNREVVRATERLAPDREGVDLVGRVMEGTYVRGRKV